MIDLYMWGTGNGLRASVALAETGLAHRVRKVDLTKGEQRAPEFLKLNPAGAIPVIVDHDGPGGRPLTLAQSGAIIVYCCEKSAKFIPTDPLRRAMAAQWFLQAATDVGATGTTVFQLENAAPEKSPAVIDFFKRRLVAYFRHVDRHLAGRDYLADEVSFADFMLYPNYALRKVMLEAEGGMDNLRRWGARMAARPGVQKGMNP
ncbi:MAG: glutathione S-transferase family protein [Burkholderiales bacterium]|nr:glutathione S-transferase family protein [Burkholderiales bacterium]